MSDLDNKWLNEEQQAAENFDVSEPEDIIQRATDGILEVLKEHGKVLDDNDLDQITRLVKLACLDTQIYMLKNARDFLDEGFRDSVQMFLRTKDKD